MQNDYDRIFKEEYLPLIAKIFTGLDYANTQALKDKIQLTPTLEREADDFRMVLDKNGKVMYGVQLEVHITDEDLRPRSQLHHAMFFHKFLIPLRQVIIYAGSKKKPSKILQNRLDLYGENRFVFEVYILNRLPVDALLESNNPAEVILAILADYHKTESVGVIRKILARLFDLSGNTLDFEKYSRQLHVLSKLRKLQPVLKKEFEAMPAQLFSIKDDLFYQKGHEQGIEKGIEQGIEKGIVQGIEKGIEQGMKKGAELEKNMDILRMLKKGFSPETVADVLEVSLERVLDLQKQHDKPKD